MLTSFFGKSKPINFILLGLYIFVGLLGYYFLIDEEPLNNAAYITYPITLLGGFFSLLLFDFILRKNSLTLNNNFGVFMFAAFFVAFSAIYGAKNIMMASIFILLALRRIFSMSSEKNIRIKMLDAAIWIAVASLFYFWSLLFFVVLYISIIKNNKARFRHLLIPIIGLGVIMILTLTFYVVRDNSWLWFSEWFQVPSTNFSAYNSLHLLIPTAVIIGLLIWTAISRVSRMAQVPKKFKTNYRLVFYVMLTSLFMALLSDNKDGSEMLFLIPPAAIMVTNYLEQMEEFWFKEVLLWVIIIMPLTLFFL